jgi:two-component system, cell cycle sensor histidine kinase and response regulator CckA
VREVHYRDAAFIYGGFGMLQAGQGFSELVFKEDHEPGTLKPDHLDRLFSTHLQGACVRSGAGILIWLFTLAAFWSEAISRTSLVGASAAILYIIAINIPILAILGSVKKRIVYEYISFLMNALEILGYTGFIYFVGGFRATYLTPIYAAMIFYVGVLAPLRYPFILAALCSMAFGTMVTLEHFGYLPHQNMFMEYHYDWNMVVFVLSILTVVLFVIAFMATYTARILRSARIKLREKNSALEMANWKMKMEIDERIRAEIALLESERKLHDIFENVPDALYSHDLEGNFIETNQGFKKILGYNEKHLMPSELNIRDLVPERYKPGVEKYLAEVVEHGKSEGLISIVRKDGKEQVFEYRNSLIYEKGTPVGVRGSGRDITERLIAKREKAKLQEQLQRAQKMEAIGLLAGGVAHDLNNILSGLVSYPELLLMEIHEDSPLKKPLLTIQRSGEKAASIVQDLLTLARRGVPVSEPVNINKSITEYLGSLEHKRIMEMNRNIMLNVFLEPEIMNTLGSSVHLFKTVMNLVTNAVESMPDGGTVSITTSSRYIDRPLRGYDTVEAGDYVTLTISDTGTGMSDEDSQRIFEPFYTKKAMGRSGTGLGMAVVWGTVKDHHGYIELESKPGEGSSFTLYFPSSLEETDPKEITYIEDYRGKGETILVVDDVKEQREIASKILEKLGYQVLTAASGEEAVDYLKNKCADLLVLDMIMEPGMDGLDTYKQIHSMNPLQRVVIASGYSETDRVKEALQIGASSYIKKPYHLNKIGIAVKEALGHRYST